MSNLETVQFKTKWIAKVCSVLDMEISDKGANGQQAMLMLPAPALYAKQGPVRPGLEVTGAQKSSVLWQDGQHLKYSASDSCKLAHSAQGALLIFWL